MRRTLTPPPGTPDPRAQQIVDAINAYRTDKTVPALDRLLGMRHILHTSDQGFSLVVVIARHPGEERDTGDEIPENHWKVLAETVSMTIRSLQQRRDRGREIAARQREERQT